VHPPEVFLKKNKKSITAKSEIAVVRVGYIVKSLRILWLGHVERMSNKTMRKMIFNAKMEVEGGEDVQGSDGRM
jgi:hypothetical protein